MILKLILFILSIILVGSDNYFAIKIPKQNFNDEYGFYYSNCNISTCFEFFNQSSKIVILNKLSTSSGYDVPVLWSSVAPIIINPGKRILIGLKSQFPLGCSHCNIADFINSHCTEGRAVYLERSFRDSSFNNFNNLTPSTFILNPSWDSFINCPDSLLKERDKNNIPYNLDVSSAKDSVLIEPNLFQLFLTNTGELNGLIKLTNFSDKEIRITNIENKDSLFTFKGLPDFLNCKLSDCRFLPGKSIVLVYAVKLLIPKIDFNDRIKNVPLKIDCSLLWYSGKKKSNSFSILIRQNDITGF